MSDRYQGKSVSGSITMWLAAVVCTAFACPSLIAESTTHQGDPPNIIVIINDDQGIDAIEGARWPNELAVHTPQLANLASQGRVFDQARVNPNCSPTRAGLMAGRSAFRTGAQQVLGEDASKARPVRALQNHEDTVAEMLQRVGYTTMLFDKWHVGDPNVPEQQPPAQGFDISFDGSIYLDLDRPLVVGDEHMTRMMDMARKAIIDTRLQGEPYVMFLCNRDPHRREDDSGSEPLAFWRVDQDLLPSGESYYDEPENNIDRYRAVVEALDTSIGAWLRSIGVIDASGRYRPESNTVVLFMADNGTPQLASLRGDHAKTTLYEGGVRVPLFVFGDGVPADGRILDRLVTHLDIYDTLADIAGATTEQRGDAPRDGLSFADDIGWASDVLPHRSYAVLSRGAVWHSNVARVTITDGQTKLICDSGGVGFNSGEDDEFYDLRQDPLEINNLLATVRTDQQVHAYRDLRRALVNAWPSAVAIPFTDEVEANATSLVSMTSSGDWSEGPLPIGHTARGAGDESRIFVRFDPSDLASALDELARRDLSLSTAQLIVVFEIDSAEDPESDTGPITAHEMQADWYSSGTLPPPWMFDAHGATAMGSIDLAPHLRRGQQGSGLPVLSGTPLSLGHSIDLRDLVAQWDADPDTNHGLVLRAQHRPNIASDADQRVWFRSQVVLRLHGE